MRAAGGGFSEVVRALVMHGANPVEIDDVSCLSSGFNSSTTCSLIEINCPIFAILTDGSDGASFGSGDRQDNAVPFD